MPIYVYKCKNGHTREILTLNRDFNERVVCLQCPPIQNMVRVPAPPAPPQWKEGKPT